jgi:hypothetical protein
VVGRSLSSVSLAVVDEAKVGSGGGSMGDAFSAYSTQVYQRLQQLQKITHLGVGAARRPTTRRRPVFYGSTTLRMNRIRRVVSKKGARLGSTF